MQAYPDELKALPQSGALTLLVAESDPKQKDVLIRLIMNMLSSNQD